MATIEVQGSEAIEIDLRDYPAKVQKAYLRAAKRAIDSGRSVMVKLIAADTGLKQKVIRENITMRYELHGDTATSMRGNAKRIPLIAFRAQERRPHGVSSRLPGGHRAPNAFIATMRVQRDTDAAPWLAGTGGEHRGVFRRTQPSRLPIAELHGPSVGQVFSKFRQQVRSRVLEVFQKNFDHELEFVKGGAGAGTD